MQISKINKTTTPKLIIVMSDILLQDTQGILTKYLMPLGEYKNKVQIVGVPLPEKGKVKKADFVKEWADVMEYAETMGCTNIAVGITEYMKFITNSKKAYRFEVAQGTKEEIGGFNIYPLLNFLVLSFSPDKKKLLARSINYIKDNLSGNIKDDVDPTKLKHDLIYKDPKSIKKALDNLLKFKKLTCDIESTGLKFESKKLLTMSFSWNKESAVCFAIHEKYSGSSEIAKEIRGLLADFFVKYWKRGHKVIGHNFLSFDWGWVGHEIMRDSDWSIPHYDIINDANIDDTLIMAYLVHNSTDRPPLGLKELAYPIMGNYDGNIDQSKLIEYPLEEVARYNNLDCIANWYVYDRLVEDVKPYQKLYDEYLPITKAILKMKMNGFKVDLSKVAPAHKELSILLDDIQARVNKYQAIQDTEYELNKIASDRYNNSHIKQKSIDEFNIEFKAGSTNHKTILFRDVLGMEPVKYSKKTKNPSYDKEVMKEYSAQAYNTDASEIADIMMEFSAARIVDSTFLKTFEKLAYTVDGDDYLFTNFNMNGTISSRMSSNSPNFMNMPSGSKYGELVKSCFDAPEGFIFAGADFSALEDVQLVNASKDAAKFKVFNDGFDGHCFNTSVYFKDELERRGIFIDRADKDSVNSIADLAPDLRQDSKSVTFALAYGGTYMAIMRALGCSKEAAEEILENYWSAYSGVKAFYEGQLEFALEHGYVVSMFNGLHLKVPNLQAKSVFIQEKEIRTMNNFTIQSSGFLTLRAIRRIQDWIEEEGLVDDIKIVNSIYDSIYFYIRDDAELISRANAKIVELMIVPVFEDELLHNRTALEIGYSWDDHTKLSNIATANEIREILDKKE